MPSDSRQGGMIAISLRFCLRPLHLLANCEETYAFALSTGLGLSRMVQDLSYRYELKD